VLDFCDLKCYLDFRHLYPETETTLVIISVSIGVLKIFSCFLFSSPEDNVLMVSFCNGPLSVVHGPCVHPCANNFLKQLLLLNHLAKFVETLQGCFLHKALPKIFKELNSIKNSGCHGNRKILFTKILKDLIVKNKKC
jgi:hypothetical protein